MRRIATLTVTAALAAGVLLTSAPAQAGSVTCDVPQMQQQIARLKEQAAAARHRHDDAAANRLTQQANTVSAKMHWCIDRDDNM